MLAFTPVSPTAEASTCCDSCTCAGGDPCCGGITFRSRLKGMFGLGDVPPTAPATSTFDLSAIPWFWVIASAAGGYYYAKRKMAK